MRQHRHAHAGILPAVLIMVKVVVGEKEEQVERMKEGRGRRQKRAGGVHGTETVITATRRKVPCHPTLLLPGPCRQGLRRTSSDIRRTRSDTLTGPAPHRDAMATEGFAKTTQRPPILSEWEAYHNHSASVPPSNHVSRERFMSHFNRHHVSRWTPGKYLGCDRDPHEKVCVETVFHAIFRVMGKTNERSDGARYSCVC